MKIRVYIEEVFDLEDTEDYFIRNPSKQEFVDYAIDTFAESVTQASLSLEIYDWIEYTEES